MRAWTALPLFMSCAISGVTQESAIPEPRFRLPDVTVRTKSGSELRVTNIVLWPYSAPSKKHVPWFQAQIVNTSKATWKDLAGVLHAEEGPNRRWTGALDLKLDYLIAPGETTYARQQFETATLKKLEPFDQLVVSFTSVTTERRIAGKAAAGMMLMKAADCAADYRAITRLQGIALRTQIAAFVSTGCGEVLEGKTVAVLAPNSGPSLPGFVSVSVHNPTSEQPFSVGWLLASHYHAATSQAVRAYDLEIVETLSGR